MRLHALLLGGLLLASLPAAPGHARSRRSVAILTAAPRSPLVLRLRAELERMELLPVVRVRPAAELASAGLDVLARTAAAPAGVAVTGSSVSRVWIIDAAGRINEVRVAPEPGDTERRVAVRALELLRARMDELIIPPAAEAPEPPLASIHHQLRSPAERPFGVRLLGGVSTSPGSDLAVTGNLWLFGGWRALTWLELELMLMTPLVPGVIDAPGGPGGDADTIDVLVGLAGLGAILSIIDRSPVRPVVGLGTGLMLVHMRSAALARSQVVLAAALYGRAGVAIRATSRLFVRLDAMLGLAMPRPVVEFAADQAANLGRPLVSFAAGLELRL